MANKYMKRCLASQVIREMQIKITVRYHFIPLNGHYKTKQTNKKKQRKKKPKHQRLEPLRIVDGNGATLLKTVWQILKKVTNRTTLRCSHFTFRHISKSTKSRDLNGYLYIHVHSSIMLNSQKGTAMHIASKMNK